MGQNNQLRLLSDGTIAIDVIARDPDGNYVAGGGGGGGGGGDASAANQTNVQALAGNNASKAIAVQGIDSGKAIAVSLSGVSTAANQATGNTSLSNIDGKLPTLASGRVPVDGSGVTQPISASALPLPSGAATAANQSTGNTSLSSIDTKTPALVTGRVPVDGSGVTQPISASALPLPSGAATAANQSTGNTSLSSIDTKTPSLGQGVMSASVPVVIASNQSNLPVIPQMSSSGNLGVTTASVGTNWTAFSSQALKQITLSNQSGVNVEIRQGGAGVGFQIPSGTFYTFFGLTNSNQLEARRVDQSNTQVTLTSRWES